MAYSKRTEYTAVYRDLCGVDLSGSLTDGHHPAYLENMYRDYDGTGGALLESIPGYRRLASLGEKINALHYQRGEGGESYIIIHSGTALYRAALDAAQGLTTPARIAAVKDGKSVSFQHGYDLFLLDGEKMVRVDKSGTATTVGETGAEPYVPTTHINGVPHEQRNLLNLRFREVYNVGSVDEYRLETGGIYYRITDPDAKTCEVSGLSDSFRSDTLSVPTYATIGAERYLVTEIADGAVKGGSFRYLRLSEGLVRIGEGAFEGCTKLYKVFAPDSLDEISAGAFSGCTSLAELYLGAGLATVGYNAFSGCTALKKLYTSGLTTRFSSVDVQDEVLAALTPSYSRENKTVELMLPLHSPAYIVNSATLGGEDIQFTDCYKDGDITGILITAPDRADLEGKEIVILATASENSYKTEDGRGALFGNSDYTGSPIDAVTHCTVCECFDGRVFLSGNPSLPNTVIYCGFNSDGKSDPTYFGYLSYFNDGVGAFPVISILSADGTLAVFKAENDGSGSIFFHTPADTGSDLLPRIYPVESVHGGASAVGVQCAFFDEPVFLTRRGLFAILKRTLNLEREVGCRSHAVNPSLLLESLADATIVRWCGYLAVCVGGKIYLADSRATVRHPTGEYEYEWYCATGIGTYKNATRVYRYASTAVGDLRISPSVDERVPEGVEILGVSVDGENHTAVRGEDGALYLVFATDEMVGGDFSPMCSALGIDDELLIFGTESGDICIFNNDMRGAPPPESSEYAEDGTEPYTDGAHTLHPAYYAFVDHAPTYRLTTPLDDCGIEGLTKSTVKHSMTVKCSVRGNGRLTLYTATDRSGYTECAAFNGTTLDFSALDFSSLSFDTSERTTLPIAEREKDWIEKQITVSSSDFRTPIGIYSIGYRFTIKGNVKKSR